MDDIPIGTDTPTNLPLCRAGPVEGTKFPRMMPSAIASRIQRARKRSSQPSALKAEMVSGSVGSDAAWFSGSVKPLTR